jgi:hypothetical protein
MQLNGLIKIQCGKFVSRSQDIGHVILLFSTYLLLNFQILVAQFPNFPVGMNIMHALIAKVITVN